MIARDSRNRLAEALRHYVSGRITNDELFAASVSVDRRDREAVAVKMAAWLLYDDLKTHFVENRLPPRSEARREVARWIVFLHSDVEYIWPGSPAAFVNMFHNVVNFLTFGWWWRRTVGKWEQRVENGRYSMWPFSGRAEFEQAINQPKLLAGSSRTKA
jgi:hypothetical protein